jgi:PAS domain S-box-containing protein
VASAAAPAPPAAAAPRNASPSLDELLLAYATYPVATAITYDGVVAYTNEAFDQALGMEAGAARGKPLATLLPPLDGGLPIPRPNSVRSYRTRVDGVLARVDLAGAPAIADARGLLVTALLHPTLPDADTAADQALLALSRELAEARAEDQITQALARALEVLFPARSFAIRLVDPETLALTTLYARGRLRSQARSKMTLRRVAVERTGLSRPFLESNGIAVTEKDEPLFERSEEATAVPLAVGGQLFGIVNLEYERGAPGSPQSDGSLLYQLANHAALGVRNLRSIEELTYLKTYLEGLIEHANALIAVVNRGLEVIVWNAALVRLTGVTKDEALGKSLLSRVPSGESGRIEETFSRGFAGESMDGLELRLWRKDGGEVRVAINTAPIRNASGDVEGVVAIGQDLTLLRSLQAAAEHAERLAGIGRLVAGVVHELNNPLTAVNMYSDALVEKLGLSGHDPADVDKLRAIREGGLRIQRLARDLVTYAKPTGGRTEPVDLAGVLEEAARLAKPALKDSSAVVERVLEVVPPVEANRPSLVQVFVNLIRNAAQATLPGGRVRLGLEAEGARVKVTVADEGSGMNPDEAARAFEPFYTTRTGIGIGLGLPIVQGIVQRHGGTVDLQTAPGRGTTVTVTLPVKR